MKYNKIAMLVAGGLLVGASGSVFAVTFGDITATIGPFGTLTGLDATTVAISADLDGTNTLASLNPTPVVTDDFCYQGNTTALATNHSIFLLANPQGIGAWHAGTGRGWSMDIGGATINLQAYKLRLDGYDAAGVDADMDKVIDYTLQVTSDVTEASRGQVDTQGQYGVSCGTSPYKVLIRINDLDTYQQSGTYTLMSPNSMTLTHPIDAP